MAFVQSFEMLLLAASRDTATIFLPHNSQLGTVAQWVAAFAALAGLLLATFSARWAARQWRLQYFTKEWANTIQFLFANPQFLDSNKNRDYRQKYLDEDLLKYQLVARLSIGYVDDLYHLRTGKYLKSWLRGSVRLFVQPHYSWFLDNKDAYEKKFVAYINDTVRTEGTP